MAANSATVWVELTEWHGEKVSEKRSLAKRTLEALWRLIKALFAGKLISLVTSLAYQAGFAWEWVRLVFVIHSL